MRDPSTYTDESSEGSRNGTNGELMPQKHFEGTFGAMMGIKMAWVGTQIKERA